MGMPRRYADYLPSDGFTTLHMVSAGLRQSHVIMAGWCGDTPWLAFSRPGW
jgi:heme/copper-type cytochrome/quinol oxidase subunit 1